MAKNKQIVTDNYCEAPKFGIGDKVVNMYWTFNVYKIVDIISYFARTNSGTGKLYNLYRLEGMSKLSGYRVDLGNRDFRLATKSEKVLF